MATTNSETFQLTTPNEREFVIERLLDAPRELVWEVWTKPEHIARWWGCDQSTISVCESDLQPGGKWRNVLTMEDGKQCGFSGIYHEIDAPHRLVHTFMFEPMPEHLALVTVLFEERDGKTFVTETTRHASTQVRDEHLQSGMETGLRQSLDRLEEYCASLILVA
ncbi:putative conserved protein YndB, AHSA1/START domain [Abditibacterium utsteinense]|uniref:Putative conserved protein YndB, AHSA1/START domain n=1 Tax=Abditibacterium utsteinense TaxID=1960156 RepID=A0A2S8STJ9_9BACT|nr:SRPBCC family protein [Abditibacterium utsteinense]PQV64133.1 putative conserved protein YndB, AHSA1/START domain [Abditibacterium utsteinense]